MNHTLPGLSQFDTKTIRDRIQGLGRKQAPTDDFTVEVDPALVEELVRRFPNDCPEPGNTAADTMLRRQGEQRVIRLLARVSIDQHPQDFGGS